jgi:hypothetical protein
VPRFVPVADEVWRLQRGHDAESLFFQAFANWGHYRGAGGSRQGIYVVTPSGKLLASANELNADRLVAMLQDTLGQWEALDPQDRRRGLDLGSSRGARWEDSCPDDGLVLIETFRDVSEGFDPDVTPIQPSNRDHAWFSEDEARALAHSEEGAAEAFLRRLARFHFVDAVRGQALPFANEELQDLELRISPDAVERDGELRLRMTGHSTAIAKGPWLMGPSSWTPKREYPRSVSVEIDGSAVWNEAFGEFTNFELVAIGTRTGHTQINGRGADDGPAPIGFHFALSKAGARIPPAYVSVYDADWMPSRLE